MTQVWDTDLPDSLKIVLLALADCADDDGRCWPSIETLRRKTSKKSARTVQGAIARLVEMGHLSRREVVGRGNIYAVHPRSDCRGARIAGVQSLRDTPAAAAPPPATVAPKPSKNHQEPSMKGARVRAPGSSDGCREQEVEGGSGEITPPNLPHRLPGDWQCPPIAALPPAARRLAEQWPRGGYEAQTEAFRLHWLSEQGVRARKTNWTAALGKWVINSHSQMMRDARGGVSWEVVATPAPGEPRRVVLAETPAKRREQGKSFTLHTLLRRELGEQIYETWLAPAALLVCDGGVTVVVASAFQRGWIEDRFAGQIRDVARALIERPWVRFEVQPPRAEGDRANG